MAVLPKHWNFSIGTVSAGYDAAATSIVLVAGDGAAFPPLSAGDFFWAVWWNFTAFTSPADDPNAEIVKVTARTADTLTIVRGEQTALGGKAASTKNDNATYKIALIDTAGFRDLIEQTAVDVGKTVWVTEDAYGAKGDGVTDDAAAIQAAIDDVNVNEIVFPPGTYLLGSALALKSNLRLRGSGVGVATLKAKNAVGADMFTGTGLSFLSFEAFSFDGNKANQVSGNSCFTLGSSTDIELAGCHVFDFKGDAVNQTGTCDRWIVRGSLILTNDGKGVRLDGDHNVVTGNVIRQNGEDGVLVTQVSNDKNVIVGNNLTANAAAVTDNGTGTVNTGNAT